MVKILIIDDDVLTRKGIQTLMPWSRHHMTIVGEAANGKAALEFLEAHAVDLALVDLDMPVMDGMTFIREASARYPDLNYVVLTVHTEFEYIQNVLRLGAIDYIAKTQFDQENFDQILDRINAGIARKNMAVQPSQSARWKNSKILYPDIYALVTQNTDNDEQIYEFWELNGLDTRPDVYEIMPGLWLFTDDRQDFLFPNSFTDIMLLSISDVHDMTYDQLGRLLRTYMKEQFFYDYQPVKKVNHKHAYELSENEYITDEKTLKRLKEDWVSLNWIHENELFDKFRFDLKNSKLKFSSLYHLLLTLESVWNASYSEFSGHRLTLPETFHCWSEVEEWLMQLYERSNLFSANSKYSQDVIKNILQVKNTIDAHYASPIDTTEVARSAHMSYGYFSRCFHDIIGVSFSDYCIQVRIRHAQEFLKNTGRTVQQIAYDVGYNDEKYFSRLFKKSTGMSPSEYRRAQR